jgi:redox-sensing transcriptional repressor
MSKGKIPQAVITRLSLYYRVILESRKSFLSSDEIARLTNFTSAQVRRDLGYFGQFGTPGKGYDAKALAESILKILGLDRKWDVALVGVGNLGSALLSYKGFLRHGFNISCAFDADPKKVGKKVNSVPIRDIKDLRSLIRGNGIRIAILAVPKEEAQGLADALVEAGIKAILNFAPIRPNLNKSVAVLNIDLSIELERLAHFLAGKTNFSLDKQG